LINLGGNLVALAVFSAAARSTVSRDPRTQALQYKPEPEGPGRLVKQFTLLASALAIVRGRERVKDSDYEVVKKVARDTMPHLRLETLSALWHLQRERPATSQHTRDIAIQANIPNSTAKLGLEDLALLGLVDRTAKGSGETAPLLWQPSQLMKVLVNESEIFA